MELQEILDLVEGRKSISEMSFPLKQVRLNLMSSALLDKRIEHLVLIYYFRNEQEANHWKKEIASFVPKSPYVKGRGRLDYKETFHLIWKGWEEDEPLEFYKGAFLNARYDEEEKRRESSLPGLPWSSIKEKPEVVLSFMEDFHFWAAKKLSENGKIYELETVSTIDSLLEKYGVAS